MANPAAAPTSLQSTYVDFSTRLAFEDIWHRCGDKLVHDAKFETLQELHRYRIIDGAEWQRVQQIRQQGLIQQPSNRPTWIQKWFHGWLALSYCIFSILITWFFLFVVLCQLTGDYQTDGLPSKQRSLKAALRELPFFIWGIICGNGIAAVLLHVLSSLKSGFFAKLPTVANQLDAMQATGKATLEAVEKECREARVTATIARNEADAAKVQLQDAQKELAVANSRNDSLQRELRDREAKVTALESELKNAGGEQEKAIFRAGAAMQTELDKANAALAESQKRAESLASQLEDKSTTGLIRNTE